MLFLRSIIYRLKVLWARVLKPEYGIRRGYLHRKTVLLFSDEGNADEYQKEVYAFSRNFYDEKELSGVLDMGCGSAFKLLANFQNSPKAGLAQTTISQRNLVRVFRSGMEITFRTTHYLCGCD